MPKTVTKVMLIVGGFALMAVGAVIAAQSVGVLLMAGLLSPLLINFGTGFFEMLASPVAWLIGGTVVALLGLGLLFAAFNLRRSTSQDESLRG